MFQLENRRQKIKGFFFGISFGHILLYIVKLMIIINDPDGLRPDKFIEMIIALPVLLFFCHCALHITL